MLNCALSLLKKIEENGYQAYIVGGFVRDFYLKKESHDIDITTSATPLQLKKILKNVDLSYAKYGSISFQYQTNLFQITTFRVEDKYQNHRAPKKVTYTSSLEEDLIRRDFTINTLCMDSSGNIIDLLNGTRDLENQLIRMVGDASIRIKEDALRILRAIRLATILNFSIEDTLKSAIIENRYLVKELSLDRKKEELNKIFASKNISYGIYLLQQLKLDTLLNLSLNNVSNTNSLLGIWAQIDPDLYYTYTKKEKRIIVTIQTLLQKNILEPVILYQYGLAICQIVGKIQKINSSLIKNRYKNLPIHNRKEISLNSYDIIQFFQGKTGRYLNEVYQDLEKKILNGTLKNEKEVLLCYLYKNYHDIIQ